MKFAIFVLAVLGCSLALPSPPLASEDEYIKGENVYIEPLSNYTVDVPVDGRIVGGSEVPRNSVPHQVALIINGASFCGGSLISTTFVLTAAHCTISASTVNLRFGAHQAQATESTQVRVTVSSSNILNHPQYAPSTLTNDVALIRLPSPISLNNNIRSISLAPANAGTFAGSSAFTSGWGRVSDSSNAISPVLRGVTVTIITNAVCQNTFGSNVIRASTICTSGAGTVGACNGDSGGPLVVGSVLVGVTSFVSARGCQSGLPSGFARVSSFRSWISQNAGV